MGVFAVITIYALIIINNRNANMHSQTEVVILY